MKKYILLAATAVLLSFISTKLVPTKISSHVTMDIHKDMELVPLAELSKYEKQVVPMAVYETADQEIKLVTRLIKESEDTTTAKMFNSKESKKSNAKDVKLEHMFRKSALYAQFDNLVFHQDGVQTINDNETIVYEYSGTLTGKNAKGEEVTTTTYIYNQICFKKNKTYILNFSCPEDRREEWQKTAGLMMKSVKIRK